MKTEIAINLVTLVITDINAVKSRLSLLDAYVETYTDLCPVCAGDLVDGGGEEKFASEVVASGEYFTRYTCADSKCAGPSSLTKEDIFELALDSWCDNAHEAGFDVEILGVLIPTLQAAEEELLSKYGYAPTGGSNA